jgi:hypothetical protein
MVVLPAAIAAEHDAAASAKRLDVREWRVIKSESGPVDYYQVVLDPAMPFIRGRYVPPAATTVLGFQIPDADRGRARTLQWQWRAMTLPRGGDECTQGKEDSAAVVYLTWKRMLRWYTLKYVWSPTRPKGTVCDRRRNAFVAQDTVVLQSGGPLGVWRTEAIDLRREFRAHFADGDSKADVPDFGGVGLMTDGDQTRSESAADYAEFVLVTD